MWLRVLQLLIVVAFLIQPRAVATQIKHVPEADGQVCDVEADFFLGIENYPLTIRLHEKVLAGHPQNALAHYHLGFAYGIVGRYRPEIAEYKRAVELGLIDWTLFLNLGLAYFQQADFRDAGDALRVAVMLAPERPEPHYNLALTYERLRMLGQAEQEALAALVLDPRDEDVRNIVGVLLAERGDYSGAREEWSALLADNPAYEPAKVNLAMLDHTGAWAEGGAAARFASEPVDSATAEPSADSTLLHRFDSGLFLRSEGMSQFEGQLKIK